MKYVFVILIIATSFLACASQDSTSLIDTIGVSNTSSSEIPNIEITNVLPKSSENILDKLIPLISLLIGFFLGKLYEAYEKRKSMVRKGKEWIENFIQLEDSLVTQVDNISTFLSKNPQNQFKISDPNFEISLNCSVFDALDENSLVPYLEKKRKMKYKEAVKTAGKLKNTVAILKNNSSEYKQVFSDLQVGSGLAHEGFKKSFNAYRKHEANYILELSNLPNPTEVQQKVAQKVMELSSEHVKPHSDSFTLDPFKLSEEFMRPYFSNAVHDIDNPNLSKATDSLSEADQFIQDLIAERRAMRSKVGKFQKSYERCLKSVKYYSDSI